MDGAVTGAMATITAITIIVGGAVITAAGATGITAGVTATMTEVIAMAGIAATTATDLSLGSDRSPGHPMRSTTASPVLVGPAPIR